MANEGLIKADWHINGISNMTAAVLDPDDAVRQSGIVMDDNITPGRYANLTSVPVILTGDTVKIFIGGVFAGSSKFIDPASVDDTVLSAGYFGDYEINKTLTFSFSTTSDIIAVGDGIRVYKSSDDTAITPSGATLTQDFGGEANVQQVEIILSQDNYDQMADYHVVLSGATINGILITATVGSFSIENRYQEPVARHVHK